jgi:hypothetical protein
VTSEGAFPRLGLHRLLWEHPALLVSLVYVFASAIGMLFSWSYLWYFGINFFEYAQLGDFLLASLKEPMTWGVVILTFILVWIDNTMSLRWGRKERSRWTRWYGGERYRTMNYLTALLLVVLLILVYAFQKANATMRGGGVPVEIRLAERDARFERVILGTTTQFVFTFDADANDIIVFPLESLELIRREVPARQGREND